MALSASPAAVFSVKLQLFNNNGMNVGPAGPQFAARGTAGLGVGWRTQAEVLNYLTYRMGLSIPGHI